MHDDKCCSGPTHTFIGRGFFFGLGGPLISVGAPKLINIWFNELERKLAMGIYITGTALGSIAVRSNHQFCDYVLAGDWREIL